MFDREDNTKSLKSNSCSIAMQPVTHQLAIGGMSCGGCSTRLKNVLQKNPEILDAQISHETSAGTITTSGKMSANDLISIIVSAGFSASI